MYDDNVLIVNLNERVGDSIMRLSEIIKISTTGEEKWLA